jgi:hypothetical protein
MVQHSRVHYFLNTDLKQLEIRLAEQRAVIFKNSVSVPMLDVEHTSDPRARAVCEFDCKDQGRLYAVVRDRHRYPDAVAAAKQIGIHNLVSLQEGAPSAALWGAYLKATDPSTSPRVCAPSDPGMASCSPPESHQSGRVAGVRLSPPRALLAHQHFQDARSCTLAVVGYCC